MAQIRCQSISDNACPKPMFFAKAITSMPNTILPTTALDEITMLSQSQASSQQGLEQQIDFSLQLPRWDVASDWQEQAIAQFYQHGLVICPHAIPHALCQALLEEVHQHTELKAAGVGRAQLHQQNQQIRRDQTQWLDGSTAPQRAYLAIMADISLQMNRRCFLGLTHHECHFARYQAGDFYQKHRDAFAGRSNRILTSVLYLNTVNHGGELAIYNDDETPLIQVQPQAGTLVLFESERFPHEVLPTQQLRYSIAGWFRNDSPP